jgi:membrane-bound lytic murein transglycosylase F
MPIPIPSGLHHLVLYFVFTSSLIFNGAACDRVSGLGLGDDAGTLDAGPPEPVDTGPPALRALVWEPEGAELPRTGSPRQLTRDRAAALATSLGREIEYVPVAQIAELLPALRAGRGDLVVTALPANEAPDGLAFSMPVQQVRRVVVVPKKARRKPRGPKSLRRGRWTLVAYESVEWSTRFSRALRRGLKLERLSDSVNPDALLGRIAAAKKEAGLCLSHHFDAYRAEHKDLKIAFRLERVPLALAVRADDPDLLERTNAFLYEYALTVHRRIVYRGDLRQIKRRRVIRVAMLNNSVAYFIYRGQEVGFQYELAELLSMRLGVRLEVVVPERPDDLLRLLVDDRADVALVTPTPHNPYLGRCVFSAPIDQAELVLVQPAGEPPVRSYGDLVGRTVHVRPASQYHTALQPVEMAVPGFRVAAAPDDLATEALIGQVGRGEIPLTVANSALLGVETTYRNDVQGSFVFAQARPLVFAVRKSSPKLLRRLNRFVERDCKGEDFERRYDRYFGSKKRMVEVMTEALSQSGAISPYDDLARRMGKEYGIDWRLIVAQMYQESRFDPKAKSWAGARGLLQVMPATGRQLGLKDPWDPEQNVRVGVGYLKYLIDRFDQGLPMRQRIRFALASYNAGLGHVRDARRLARARGLNPNRWFGHVERTIQLLEQPRFYHRARHGYCRGSEPAQYVGLIQNKYDAYARLMPADGKDASPL